MKILLLLITATALAIAGIFFILWSRGKRESVSAVQHKKTTREHRRDIGQVIRDMLKQLNRGQIAEIAFSLRYWDDTYTPKAGLLIPRPLERQTSIQATTTGQGEAGLGEDKIDQRAEKERQRLHSTEQAILVDEILQYVDHMSPNALRHFRECLHHLIKRGIA
jgi:hypothetical protein